MPDPEASDPDSGFPAEDGHSGVPFFVVGVIDERSVHSAPLRALLNGAHRADTEK